MCVDTMILPVIRATEAKDLSCSRFTLHLSINTYMCPQDFIELVRQKRKIEAIIYARQHLAPWAAQYLHVGRVCVCFHVCVCVRARMHLCACMCLSLCVCVCVVCVQICVIFDICCC